MVHNVGYRRGTVESGVDHAKKTAPRESALRTLAAQFSQSDGRTLGRQLFSWHNKRRLQPHPAKK